MMAEGIALPRVAQQRGETPPSPRTTAPTTLARWVHQLSRQELGWFVPPMRAPVLASDRPNRYKSAMQKLPLIALGGLMAFVAGAAEKKPEEAQANLQKTLQSM